MTESNPSSTKPYLIRAIHEWCSDNGFTPYLAVSVNAQVQVPREHVRNGEIVLNVSALATDKLMIANDVISFQARFSGRAHEIMVPIENVVAIYAKETGKAMAWPLR
ncbi:MAG: ClpXP protease specificity-enhancing factor [Betaproteobacteria bacterium]|nr:ClpXP protease specificity-enhancing factor [Betaproteobacteria bacterium]